jgi:DNA-binding FadR family transcriptional regulator
MSFYQPTQRAPKAETLDQAVTEKIGSQIVSGSLPAGQLMRLDDLSTEFGVSRTVARDAVRELETLGLIESRRRVGLVVRPMSNWSVYHPKVITWRVRSGNPAVQLASLAELRLGVEPIAARFAAERRSAAQAEELMTLARIIDNVGRTDADAEAIDEYLEADIAFHSLILRASDNEMFASLSVSVAAALRGRTEQGLLPDIPAVRAVELHVRVADAILARSGPPAEQAMRAIVSDVIDEVRGTR